MIINKITLHNIGPFLGQHEIAVRPKRSSGGQRTIILIGGQNGAGKTTLFEAIQLCLYGSDRIVKSSANDYQSYLTGFTYSSSFQQVPPSYASVGLEFDYGHSHETCTYSVTRSWSLGQKKVKESLEVLRNGKPLDDLDQDGWPGLVNELFPRGLTQLFFFDGERIEKIVRDSEGIELKESIRQLYGLDIVERLQADLAIFQKRQMKALASDELRGQINQCEQEIRHVGNELAELQDTAAELRAILDRDREVLRISEDKVAAYGGAYAVQRADLVAEKKQLEESIDVTSNSVREIIAGLYPICLNKRLAEAVVRQATQERQVLALGTAHQYYEGKVKELLAVLASKEFWSDIIELDKGTHNRIKRKINTTALDLLSALSYEGHGRAILEMSEKQTNSAVSDIDTALKHVPSKLKEAVRTLEQAHKRLQEVHVAIERAPDDDSIRPLMDRLREVNAEVALSTQRLAYAQQSINEKQHVLENLERKLKQLQDKAGIGQDAVNEVGLAKEVTIVLGDYKRAVADRKLKQLEQEFASTFNHLSRKTDFVTEVRIDPVSLEVLLVERNGLILDKSKLSAGEAEIYSIAMLWSLARTSGKNLPFIIDTPLGRLDSAHRSNLITLFFPSASHQTIVLSTDTEVDQQYYEQLQPFISESYHIKYLSEERRSVLEKGYFWKRHNAVQAD